jgi:Flp pilus assembly protein TadG
MDAATIINEVRALAGQLDAHASSYSGLALLGLGAAIVLTAVLAVILLRLVLGLASSIRRSVSAASIRRITEHGARIVITRSKGGRRRQISRFVRDGVERHLSSFMFGGPFRVLDFPAVVNSEAEAALVLKRTEADVVVWTERPARTRGVVRILSRLTNPTEKPRPAQSCIMPKIRTAWNDPLAQAITYATAKQFRPALGRPQDFRAERLQPVVETLLTIISEKPAIDETLLAELIEDASAGALQLALSGDQIWIEKAVEISRNTLADINRSDAPDRWISAKITLGRALRVKAERRFDPVLLREAISHLTDALDALRAEPRFKLAESAAQAIGEAQKLVGARRKFSISGGTI